MEAAARIGASVCEIHTGPYAHAFYERGRDAESAAVRAELDKIRVAGEAIRERGMRFNAGHALNYFNVQPVAGLPGVRELHIGHAIVSRAVFVGMREAVRRNEAADARGGIAHGTVIYGIGTDICAVARMARLLVAMAIRRRAHPDDRRSRAIWPEQLRRRAAGEALCRQGGLRQGLGTGIRPPVTLRNVGVGHDLHGKPILEFARHWRR